jgi:hypothetical protein
MAPGPAATRLAEVAFQAQKNPPEVVQAGFSVMKTSKNQMIARLSSLHTSL